MEINKPEILIILSRFPFPLEKGDKLRAYYQLIELSSHYQIHLITLSEGKIDPADYHEVSRYCKSVSVHRLTLLSKLSSMFLAFLNNRPFQTGYFYRSSAKREINRIIKGHPISHIYCQLVRTTEYVKDIHHIPKTLDYMDALSSGIKRRISKQPWYVRWFFKMEATRMTQYERVIFDYFEVKTIISDQDRNLIPHPDKDQILCISNGVDPSFLETRPRPEHYDLVFVGNMSYPPNIDAVSYIVHQLLPELPGRTLLIAGANPHQKVLELAKGHPQVHVSGWMEDIRDAYCNGKVFLAPMLSGTGMQNKLLEAMALETPCVTTSLANNAIHASADEEILVADNKQELITAVHSLLESNIMRTEISERAKELIRSKYLWKNTTEPLIESIRKHLAERV